MITKRILAYFLLLVATAAIVVWVVLGPDMLAGYNDAMVLDRVSTEPAAGLAGGFRYRLTANERVFILSMALQNRVLPQSDYAVLTRGNTTRGLEPWATFAYTENRRGPSPGELTADDAARACAVSLEQLRASGALPECRFEPETDPYDIQFYTAVDMLDPQKYISVWQIVYDQDRPAADYRGALLEAWLDAETGKLYGFSLRSETEPENFDPGAIMDAWRAYAEVGGAEMLTGDNPLWETTPHYQKYTIDGMGSEKTVVTVGYYEGIHEIFLRIT